MFGPPIYYIIHTLSSKHTILCSNCRVHESVPVGSDEACPKPQSLENEKALSKVVVVNSSFKLKLPPHLIITKANIKLIETIGQGKGAGIDVVCTNVSNPLTKAIVS